MEKFKLSESILADHLILLKRSHEHDEEMWRAIEESRAFIREYLFWVDGTQSLSDVEKATDMFSKPGMKTVNGVTACTVCLKMIFSVVSVCTTSVF